MQSRQAKPQVKKSEAPSIYLLFTHSLPIAGQGYNAHAVSYIYRPIMSFIAPARFLISTATGRLLRINAWYAANFVMIAAFVQHVVLVPCQPARRFVTAVIGPLPHALPDQSCGQCWRTPPPTSAIHARFAYIDFSRALILRLKQLMNCI